MPRVSVFSHVQIIYKKSLDESRWKFSLREKYLYLEFFLSVFSCIRREYGEILCIYICPYSVQMRENTDQKIPNTNTFHAVSRETSINQ